MKPSVIFSGRNEQFGPSTTTSSSKLIGSANLTGVPFGQLLNLTFTFDEPIKPSNPTGFHNSISSKLYITLQRYLLMSSA